MIKSIDDAKHLALDLSDNLYYEDNFTTECFRVFLDSLPTIFRVSVQVSYDDACHINGLATIVFVGAIKKSISIVFHKSWIYYTYFRHLRKVPYSVHMDFLNPYDNPLPH